MMRFAQAYYISMLKAVGIWTMTLEDCCFSIFLDFLTSLPESQRLYFCFCACHAFPECTVRKSSQALTWCFWSLMQGAPASPVTPNHWDRLSSPVSFCDICRKAAFCINTEAPRDSSILPVVQYHVSDRTATLGFMKFMLQYGSEKCSGSWTVGHLYDYKVWEIFLRISHSCWHSVQQVSKWWFAYSNTYRKMQPVLITGPDTGQFLMICKLLTSAWGG